MEDYSYDIPTHTLYQEYFDLIVPRILVLLTPDLAERVPLSHKRAAAFTLSRMLGDRTASDVLLKIMHEPFLSTKCLPYTETEEETDVASASSASMDARTLILTPIKSLHTISTLLTNTDPSPRVISSLLTPLFPSLYSIHEHFHPTRGRSKASDPVVREIILGMITTWAKVVGKEDVVNCLWEVIETEMKRVEQYSWELDITGELRKAQR
jgi:hypothetical protein